MQDHCLDLLSFAQAPTSCLYAPLGVLHAREFSKHFEIDPPASLRSLSNNHHEASSILQLYLVHRKLKFGGAMQSQLYVGSSLS